MPFGFSRKKSNNGPNAADEHAPGWDALDRRFESAFPGQEPHHWATDSLLPAQDGPSGISAYRDGEAWFYVTYGLSDLFELFETPDAEDETRWSGFGFELTMRVRSADREPPGWPVELLNSLGKYVYKTGEGFAHGHRLDPGGPITGGSPTTRLTALAFAADPAFDGIETSLGNVEFITVIGITGAELSRMKATSTDAVLDELRQGAPNFETDPAR